MISNASSISEYLENLPEDRKPIMEKLHKLILKSLPKGFQAEMSYGMIGYVVPHKLYPSGYHCDPSLPLPFMSIASQKGSINVYHMGIYADPELLDWFVKEYSKKVTTKLDMGKSCIRFKKINLIPFDLIEDLCKKMTPKQWIALYEDKVKS